MSSPANIEQSSGRAPYPTRDAKDSIGAARPWGLDRCVGRAPVVQIISRDTACDPSVSFNHELCFFDSRIIAVVRLPANVYDAAASQLDGKITDATCAFMDNLLSFQGNV